MPRAATCSAATSRPGAVALEGGYDDADRVLRDGCRHAGTDLAFGRSGNRIDFLSLVGASVQLYPQTDVFIDLAVTRAPRGRG